jgi:hypothetical protein
MTTTDRRSFLINGARAGITVCGLCVCSSVPTWAGAEGEESDKPLDPKSLDYCGYTCPKDCKFLKATLEDNLELKKEAFKIWKIEERFGVAFDPEQAICYGCKALDKPQGIVVARCDVRACAQEKKLDCCIECGELEGCDKDLWRRFPDFKKQVIAMRERYLRQSQG